MKSIRRQLMLQLFVMTAFLWCAGGIGIYIYVSRALRNQFDDALQSKALALSRLIAWDEKGKLIVEIPEQQLQEFRRTERPEYFELWLPDGNVFMRSDSLNGSDLKPGGTMADLKLADGRAGRQVTFRFVPHSEADEPHPAGEPTMIPQPHESGEAVLVLASSREGLDVTLTRLMEAFILVEGLTAVICAVAMKMTVERGLRRLDQLKQEAERFNAESLHMRFSVDRLPEELQPIVGRLNELLSRIEQAFERERRFTAHAAHELRTPLAELRAMSEVVLKWPRERGDATKEFGEVHAISRQMERLVESLLAMARCGTGRQRVELREEMLEEVLREDWKPFEERAKEGGVRVTWEIDEDLRVSTDRALLTPILRNLFSNAVEYSPRDSEITIQAQARGGVAEVRIVNAAPELEAGDLEHLFEPFWRKESSRTGTEHTGLGLAVAAEHARVLEMELRAELIEERKLAIMMRFEREASRRREFANTLG